MVAPGFDNLDDALGWLDSHLNREAIAGRIEGLSLEPMQRLVDLLGNPEREFPAIHVTGTDGKGSVIAFAEAILVGLGLRVGATTSPHLYSVTERCRISGEDISSDELTELLGHLAIISEATGEVWSWFELMIATAYTWFANEAVDVALVEVGLLGRFDATNVITADVSICTNIGRDHVGDHDDWADRVAGEKAGIVTARRPIVLGRVDDSLIHHFEAEKPSSIVGLGRGVEVVGRRPAVGGAMVDIRTPLSTYDDLFIPAFGDIHADNAAVAIAAVEAFVDGPLPADLVTDALAGVSLPGRAQVVAREPLVVLDVAHTAQAGSALVDTMETTWPAGGSRIAVVGHLEPRDPADFLGALAAWSPDLVVACAPDSGRAIPAAAVGAAAGELDLPVEVVDSVGGALARAVQVAGEHDVILVTGSLRVVAEAGDVLERAMAEVASERDEAPTRPDSD